MSEIKGMIRTCDRCGAQVFLKCTGEGEADGRFTLWNEFEPAPDGWSIIVDVGHVCPECHAEYERMFDEYKRRAMYIKEG